NSRYLHSFPTRRSSDLFKVKESLANAQKNSSEVRTLKEVSENVQSLVKGKLSVEFDDEFKVGTQTDLPNQKGNIWMKSPLVDGKDRKSTRLNSSHVKIS